MNDDRQREKSPEKLIADTEAFAAQEAVDTDSFSPRSDSTNRSDESTVDYRSPETDASADDRTAWDSIGHQFGDYELLEKIAQGGMGVVFKAQQKKANRLVALKMILAGRFASREDVARFYSEAESAAKLDHPNIVPIFDVGKHGEHHYFSMAYVEGQSLAARIQQGPVTASEAARLGEPIARAIAYANREGVIHRDLKPGNVLLTPDGSPRVTDFGLAKQVDSGKDLTTTGQIMGTPGYMPPEQASGRMSDVGAESDVYALGAILYALVTGRPPFQGTTAIETIRQVLDREPVAPRTLNPEIDQDFETICLKCLQKPTSARYETADALADELRRFQAGEPILARPIGVAERSWRWCKRNRTVAALISGIAGSLILGIVVSSYFAMLANRRTERAQQGTQIALSALETVINTIQEKLRSIPEARELRRQLLRDSLADLQKVSGEVQSQGRVDQNTANVLVDLALLFDEVGDEDGHSMQGVAEQHFLQAVAIFRKLDIESQYDAQWLSDYARALDQLGNFYIEQNRIDEAEPFILEAMDLRRVIVRRDPDSLKRKLALSFSISNRGDCYALQREFAASLPSYEEAIDISRSLVDAQPGNMAYLTQLIDCLVRAGDSYHDMNRHDEAIKYFEESERLSQQRLDHEPGSRLAQETLSFVHERLGNHYMKTGDPQRAHGHYDEMLRLTQLAFDQDPQSHHLLDGLSVCYEKLALVNARLGDHKASAEAKQKANDLLRQLNE